jgi:hypothetical protein
MAVAAQQAVPVDQLKMTGAMGSQQLPAGSLFDLPGVSIWFDQKENNDGMSTTLNQTTQTTALFSAPFKQSDVVHHWEAIFVISQTIGTANCVVSQYFPYQYIASLTLTIQNQFSTLSYTQGGIDAAIFQAIRPTRRSHLENWVDQSGTFNTNAYSAQTYQGTASNATMNTGTQTIKFTLDLMPGIDMDLYYDLGPDGRLYSSAPQGVRTYVTPLAMAGSNRIVQPSITYAPIIAATNDAGPGTTGSSSTASGSVVINWRRYGVYQPQGAADAPLFWNWQYVRLTRRFGISQVTTIQIPMEPGLQILMFYVRMFDPTLNSNLGGALAISNVTEADLQIGSGLYRFQDTPADTQRRLMRQHGITLPEGCLAWDMALTPDNRVTNARAVNTYTTSSCTLTLTFSAQTNAGAYLVLGTEGLRYVAFQ